MERGHKNDSRTAKCVQFIGIRVLNIRRRLDRFVMPDTLRNLGPRLFPSLDMYKQSTYLASVGESSWLGTVALLCETNDTLWLGSLFTTDDPYVVRTDGDTL
jgi:hypothetical protein